MSAIELHGLSRRFGGVIAVDRVDLVAERGERHAVIGPNGAGKSTLLSMIAGSLRPSSGRIHLLDTDVTRWRAHRIARIGVGRTFQHSGRFGDETVLDNCLLAAHATGPRLAVVGRDHARRDAALEALAAVGLDDRLDDRARALSHGEARQLEIAMALAARPRLLLADEPLAGLAEQERARIGELLRGLSREMTVLFIEHDLDFVLGVADRVTVLDFGQVISCGTPSEVRADERVAAVYLGEQAVADESHRDDGARAARSGTVVSINAGRPPTGEPVLEVRGLSSGYGGTSVVDGVDLDAHPGRVMAILGRNGMGKTTLLNTIMGSVPATAGTVILDGSDVTARRTSQRARAGMALVPQGRGILHGLTVADHLLAGARAGRWTEAIVYEWFPVLGERRSQLASTLSGGEQQMLAIGRALLRNPSVLLLDEPSEGLAPLLVRRVGEIVRQLAAEGETIVLAEQNVRMAVSVADDVVVIDRGRIAFTGGAGDLAGDDQRQRVLLGL